MPNNDNNNRSENIADMNASQKNELYNQKVNYPINELSQVTNLYDFEILAQKKMSEGAFAYVSTGAADEITFNKNHHCFDKITLNPRILNDAHELDTSITLFGDKLDYPIMVDPFAFQKLMHPDGELATVKGAGKANTACVISSFTTTSLEDIQQVATTPIWFQLYIQHDKEFAKTVIRKAEASGCRAICITLDSVASAVRNNEDKVSFHIPKDITTPYKIGRPVPVTWKEVAELIAFSKLPVLIKGIVNDEDAQRAIDIGASGIIVSNHGGRKLDSGPATIEALPRVVERVGNRIPVLMDGGIRRGTDVLKAIALGADAVLLGKPIAHALGAAGADGVEKALNILQHEFEMAMKLTGRDTIESIDSSLIWK